MAGMLVYTLELAGGKYYVGRVKHAVDLDARITQHRAGTGAEWTKLHRVVNLVHTIENAAPTDEDARVIMLSLEHGMDNVRGGTFCTPTLDEAERRILGKMIDSARGTCYKCHSADHCTNECPVNRAKAAKNGGDWICPDCGNDVFGKNDECRCGKRRPKEAKLVTTEAGWKPGDWKCPRCGDHQFAKKTHCGQCGTAKPAEAVLKRPHDEGAQEKDDTAPPAKKARAETEPGVKSGDWTCTACTAHNYASRKACFKCHKVKPMTDAETVGTCVICISAPSAITVQPCGHLCLCETCAPTVDICPVCRGPLVTRQRIFQS